MLRKLAIAAALMPVMSLGTVAQDAKAKLDFEGHVLVPAPNPDRPTTRADLMALAKGRQ